MGQLYTGIALWRERLQLHLQELASYESGKNRVFEYSEGERLDVTERVMRELKNAIAMYRRVIDACESDRARSKAVRPPKPAGRSRRSAAARSS